jgi:hypothetical protein
VEYVLRKNFGWERESILIAGYTKFKFYVAPLEL